MVNYACGFNQSVKSVKKFTGSSKHFSLLRKPVALSEKLLMNFLQLYFEHEAVAWVSL